MPRIFVYGTLKRGHELHEVIKGSKFLGCHMTPPSYKMLDFGAYPGVTLGGRTPIFGEVYQVSKKVLEQVDILEGAPDLFTKIKLATPYGTSFIYLFVIDEDTKRLVNTEKTIPTGYWKLT
jgi:gamma-glutamylcyclotransferase (GGCT)/AIG2-like uncharacterized protein YtfP